MEMSVGDQDYLVGKPIDFMVNGTKKTGILKYNPGTLFTSEGFVIKSDKTYDFNKLPPGFQLLESRDKTDRMKAIETKKLEKAEHEQRIKKYAEEQAAEAERRKLKYAEEQEQKRQQEIVNKIESRASYERKIERDRIEMQQKKEKEEAEDRLLDEQMKTGIPSTNTILGDRVNYNGTEAIVTGFVITFGTNTVTINGDEVKTLLNISAAQRKKDDDMIKRNPPRNINDGYQFSGGTRRRNRKNRKTRYGLEKRS